MPERALPGFRDFYPQELADRNHITDAWRRVARRFGFQEYDGPPLEPLDLYTRKSGDEIVTQLYNFVDKGGRQVALRPEMTPTFARMVAARANALRKPVRWFSVPQLFRYERQQRGRLKEHFQLNVDIVGEADITADAELVSVCIEIARELGLGESDVRLRVSDRKLLNALLSATGIEDRQLAVVYATLDKLEREPREVQRQRLVAAGVAEDVVERLFNILAASRGREPETLLDVVADRGDATTALAERVAEYRRFATYADALGAGGFLQFDLSIVRGLAYYTGIVFELFDARGEHRAVCGGGRYDNLLDALGGVDLPALGFGMGDVVLGELLRDRALLKPQGAHLDFWVAGDEASMLPEVMRLSTQLRRAGHSVEFALRDQTLARQLKAAAAAGAASAIIIRAESAAGGGLTIRDLSSGTEQMVDRASWAPLRA